MEKQYSPLECISYLFSREAFETQPDDALRSLFTFGVGIALLAGAVGPPLIDFISGQLEKIGIPAKPVAEFAKTTIVPLATMMPVP